MKTHVTRVPDEYEEEVDKMIKKIGDSFRTKISKLEAMKIILLKSKNTNYILSDKELIRILGG